MDAWTNMIDIDTRDDLEAYVDEVALNTDPDAHTSHAIANTCVTSVAHDGDVWTLVSTAQPYHDDTIRPTDVIEHIDRRPDDVEILDPTDLRDIAVDVVASMLTDAWAEIEVDRRDHERLAQIETQRERYLDRHGHY